MSDQGISEDDENFDAPCEEDNEKGDVKYAAPSDLCQGVCLIHKFDEDNWYTVGFYKYFQEVLPPAFPKAQPTIFKPSQLRHVQNMDEMEQDEA